MSVSADRQTPFSDAPFKYVGGDPALDLVNTVDWTARGLEHDRLSGYPRLVEWAVGAGVLEAEAGRRLLHRARRESAAAGRTLARARTLRAVLHDAVLASATHGNLAGPLARLRPWIDDVHRRLQLTPGQDGSAVWSWRDDHRFDAMLWPVVRSAAALLSGQEADRLRVCGGIDCGWMYVDRSRNGLRRWCEMETCGTREKSRRRARPGGG